MLVNVSFAVPAAEGSDACMYDTVTVRAELALGSESFGNSWDLGIFPVAQHCGTVECKLPVFASPHMLPAARLHCSHAAPMPAAGALPHTPFLVLAGHEGLDEATAAALGAALGSRIWGRIGFSAPGK